MNKNKNVIIFSIAVVLALGVLFWLGSPSGGKNQAGLNSVSAPSAAESQLSADEPFFDFGTISMADGKVSREFKIKNSGSEPLMIEKIYTSCMCTSANYIRGITKRGPFGMPGHGFTPKLNERLEAGEEVVIEAIFDPTAHGPAGVGKNDRVVYLETSSGAALQLQFTAFVTP